MESTHNLGMTNFELYDLFLSRCKSVIKKNNIKQCFVLGDILHTPVNKDPLLLFYVKSFLIHY